MTRSWGWPWHAFPRRPQVADACIESLAAAAHPLSRNRAGIDQNQRGPTEGQTAHAPDFCRARSDAAAPSREPPEKRCPRGRCRFSIAAKYKAKAL
ncbi:hypothetical protein MRX96_017649 [Rhipicephalus microplus]